MKAKVEHLGRSVTAVSGKHKLCLAMRWPAAELDGLLGFAIQRTGPGSSSNWLPSVLRFPGEVVRTGQLHASNESPIQSMIWCDFGLSDDKAVPGLPAGTRFVYEVIPVRGKPGALVLQREAAVRIEVATEPEHEHGPLEPEAHFNRALSDMQEYERLFGEGHDPTTDPAALDWLARDLDQVIVDFIGEVAIDPQLRLDVAAYHLQSARVLDALAALGPRLRISLDWGREEITEPPNGGPNGAAYKRLVKAKATVHQRLKVAISHNKYMVQKRADGTAVAVLTGSTNFTDGGISTQSNQSVIVRNAELAQAYLDDFERVLNNDNAGLYKANADGTKIGSTYELYISPHAKNSRPDLDRFTALAQAAVSSRLFMTFRMTDPALVRAMLDPKVPVFGVVDRVYQGKGAEGGDELLFDEAHSADPRVVACNEPLVDAPSEDALYRELKRDGYNPLVHHKILLLDWDQPNCVVVTGSANYSANSTAHNDENSLVVFGDQRLAEEYFVEMCRLFTHWHGRWLLEREVHGKHPPSQLAADSSWAEPWGSGGRLTQFLELAAGKDGAADVALASAGALARAGATPAAQPQRALAAAPASPAAARIKHVVVLMLENRSFDQMLGQLPGVDGVTLDTSGKDAKHVNYKDPQRPRAADAVPVQKARFFGIPAGDVPPPKMNNGKVSDLYGGPSHSFPAATQQVFNDPWGPGGRNAKGTTPASNSGFLLSYALELKRTYTAWSKADPAFKMPATPPPGHLEVVMASFAPDQLPVINGLAKEFCVCDAWFSEVPGPTEPNRLFMHAATSLGFVHNPWELAMDARTIYEDIDEQGQRTWASYYHDLSDANNFTRLKGRIDKVLPFERFTQDLAHPATFPNYVFLCPRYADSPQGFANSQHAPYDVRYGEHLIADVYEALRASALWNETLLIVTYDEHGGFYDHVQPPHTNIASPDANASPTAYDKKTAGYMFDAKGRPKAEYVFNFDRLGCRVPTVLVSPWLARGQVEHRQLQHTSVLATLRKMWGLRPQPLTAREGQAATFDDLLGKLPAPRNDCPKTLPRPPLPKRSLEEALDQPLSPVQKEVFAQVNHLDGHADSGKPAPVPHTQREASAYIAERNQAHAAFHAANQASFDLYTDAQGRFRWRLHDAGKQVLAASGEGFKTAGEARAEVARVQALAAAATITTSEARTA